MCSFIRRRVCILPHNRENLKHEAQIQVPTPTRSHMFGVPLEELMGYDGEKDGLPRVVRDCVQYIREAGECLNKASMIYRQELIG